MYAAIAECVEQVDEGYPDSILSFLVSKGLSGSSKLPGGGYLLHDLLSQEYPPPCKPAGEPEGTLPARLWFAMVCQRQLYLYISSVRASALQVCAVSCHTAPRSGRPGGCACCRGGGTERCTGRRCTWATA